ncbi:discoidin domain-containing protein [Arthrobacter sp. RCC_34]|uniref:discoidin domain-containing protein n=1 Tax=Arthrobacter sp. RCC_34 TaxID=3239230 RepID=UPI0035251DC6
MNYSLPTQVLRRGAMAAAAIAALVVAGSSVAIAPIPAHAAGGTTYYVDASAGNDAGTGTSVATPWRSLDKVNASSFAPGDSVLFKGGSSWTGSLTVTSSGTAGAPITIGSYGTGRARIDGAGAVTNTVTVSNARYVTVQNLEVTNSASMTTSTNSIRRGIYVEAKDIGQVDGIAILNNYVHRVDGQGKSGGIGEGGIAVGVRGNGVQTWFAGTRISGNEVSDVNAYGISTFTTWCGGCEIYSAETGIPSSEVSGTRKAFTGLKVDQNYVHDVTGGGITPQYADNAVVEWNTVDRAASHQIVGGGGNVGIWWQGTKGIVVQYNTVRRTAYEGIYSNADGQAFDADMGTQNSVVQYNISDSNNGGFFMCLISAYQNQVRYNLSVNDKRLIFRFLSGCGGTRAHNNTIWTSSAPGPTLTSPGVNGAPKALTGIVAVDTSSNSIARGQAVSDNIIYNPSNAPYNVSGQAVTPYSNNLYWNGTASTAPAANDAGATVGDPQLTNTGASLPTDGYITPAQFNAYFAAFTPSATSPALNKGVSEWGQSKDALGTRVPVGAVDLGAIQHAVSATVTSSLGTSAGTLGNVADGDIATSWAAANGSSLPGDLTVQYGDPRKIDAVTLAAAFGQGQGPTSVDVQTWNGTGWQTQLTNAPVIWSSNSSTIEYKKLTLPATVTTSQIRIVVKSANLTWGHVALNELSGSYQGIAATSMGELSNSNVAAALVDNNPATSWASEGTSLGYLQVDGPAVTANSITLSAAFGQGQGPTQVFVQALNGDTGTWQTVVPSTAISWSSNTSTVESRTLTFNAPTTATRFEIQFSSANLTWGHVALNGISVQ